MGEKADSRAFLSARRSRRSSCQAGSAIRGMLGLVSLAETVGPVVGGDHDDLVSGARRRWKPRCVKKETNTQKRDLPIWYLDCVVCCTVALLRTTTLSSATSIPLKHGPCPPQGLFCALYSLLFLTLFQVIILGDSGFVIARLLSVP